MPNQKFSIIVCDMPWSFSDQLHNTQNVKRGASSNYQTMSLEDLKKLDIKNLADPTGTILAMWCPSSLLQSGLDLMKEYGFQHKQTYIWVKTKKNPLEILLKDIIKNISKTNLFSLKDIKQTLEKATNAFNLENLLSFGMGRLFRNTHEICLIGINNNKIYKKLLNKSQRTVSFASNLKHSSKPEHLQDQLEKMFENGNSINKLELFARRIKPGWICLGNSVCNGEDINTSISKL